MSLNNKILLVCFLGLVFVNAGIIQVETSSQKTQNALKNLANIEPSDVSKTPAEVDNPLKLTANLIENSNAPNLTRKRAKFGLNMSFEEFKNINRKKYRSLTEENNKRRNYNRNLERLEKADCWPCGVTQMFDNSPEQLRKLNGLVPGVQSVNKRKANSSGSSNSTDSTDSTTSINSTGSLGLYGTYGPEAGDYVAPKIEGVPQSFDWRTYGVVTKIKDQGGCGFCWAFANAAFLESEGIRRKIYNNKIDLSEEYLVQCTLNNITCNSGGDSFEALSKAIVKGVPKEATYRYLQQEQRSRNFYPTICSNPVINVNAFQNSGTVLSHWSSTEKTSDKDLIVKLLERPILVGVDATYWAFYYPGWKGSSQDKIFFCSEENSNGKGINHAVLLIGYTDRAWLIKNSWGIIWGQKGYGWITRDPARNCGIGNYWATLTSNLQPVLN